MPSKRLLRSEVPTHMTWDLAPLFSSREAWLNALKEAEASFEAVSKFKDHLTTNGKTTYACLCAFEIAYQNAVKIGTYANLKQSEDATDPQNQEDSMMYGAFATKTASSVSFMSSEITALDRHAYDQLFIEEPRLNEFKNYLDDVYSVKEHMLSPETERVLSALGEAFEAPYRTYNTSKAADMTFEDFEIKGEKYPNSFGLYETKYEFSTDTEIRRTAYDSFTKSLRAYNNTFASVYATEITTQVSLSRLRGYGSVTEMLLEPQKVTSEMYNKQIDTIYTELAPHMRKLAQIRKKQLGLSEIRYCDLKAPLDASFNPPANIESIKTIIIEALAVLGEDYKKSMVRAFDERWIDYADNVGKSTGAFCASPYGVHSYILISYQESMRSAFTLAHELGHAGHFTIANRTQRIFDTRPSTYFIEAPSTMNEILLANHLMKKDDSKEMKRWVILQMMGTYYHNFVTHLLEAEFQRRVYMQAEADGPITAKWLNETKLNVIKTFWGEAVVVDDAAGMTWMRQPHYYMGLYPYTYSAGLTISTAVAKQIMSEGQPAVDRWLSVLAAGGTMRPLDLALMAGIDMSTTAPVKAAVDYVGELIDELERLYQ